MTPSLKADLEALAFNAGKNARATFPRFFKTGKGEYGEGDVFLGVTVPHIRAIVKNYRGMSLKDIGKLLKDPVHECRLAALFLLVNRYEKGDEKGKKETFDFYLSHLTYVNNWDLVDSSAHQIVGAHLLASKNRILLTKLAGSSHLWSQRVAIVSTFAFIRQNQFEDTIRIAELFLTHTHDLIHPSTAARGRSRRPGADLIDKAVGWMLREMGKRDEKTLRRFLDQHAKNMPRTMLRYAIEKFDAPTRVKYMKN